MPLWVAFYSSYITAGVKRCKCLKDYLKLCVFPLGRSITSQINTIATDTIWNITSTASTVWFGCFHIPCDRWSPLTFGILIYIYNWHYSLVPAVQAVHLEGTVISSYADTIRWHFHLSEALAAASSDISFIIITHLALEHACYHATFILHNHDS